MAFGTITPARYRVTAFSLNVRREPRIAPDTLAGRSFPRGAIINVDPNSRTEAEGFVWYRLIDGGWVALARADASELYLEPVSAPIDTPPSESIRLAVPYVSQLSNSATTGNDCGQASVLMLMRYYGVGQGVTVDTLARFIGGRTTALQLIQIAQRFGLEGLRTLAYQQTVQAMLALRDPLARGRPIIVLVDYARLPFRSPRIASQNQGLHWFVVVGIEGNNLLVHDPLWFEGDRNYQGGAYLSLSAQQLNAAARPNASPSVY